MKDWKAAIRTWERVRAKEQTNTTHTPQGTFTLKGFYGTFTFPNQYKGMSLHACLNTKKMDGQKLDNTELAELEKLDNEQKTWLENLKAEESSTPLF